MVVFAFYSGLVDIGKKRILDMELSTWLKKFGFSEQLNNVFLQNAT